MQPFVHLHVHSQYSLLDGQASIARLVDKAHGDGMKAIALTDHGAMYGIKEFLNYVNKKNSPVKSEINKIKGEIKKLESTEGDIDQIQQLKAKLTETEKKLFKPIVGCECYLARRDRFQMSDKVDGSGWHLVVLAKNLKGYKNLIKIVSKSWTEGFYYRPRIDKELLEKYSEGLIVSSACLGGEISRKVDNGQINEAEEAVQWYKRVFGDDYYIELQRHKTDRPDADQTTYPKQQKVNEELIRIARKYDVKLIATNDVHFVNEEDADAHDRLICLSTGRDFDDPDRMRYSKQEWLKTTAEMNQVFADIPEALSNTLEIADKVEFYSIDNPPLMPFYPIDPEFGTEEQYKQKYSEQDLIDEFGEDTFHRLGDYDKVIRVKLESDYLTHLTKKGAQMRYGENLNDEIIDRLKFELDTIKNMGFPGYFLIVQDFISAAREMDVAVGPGRGSAAGSAVAYCLRITDIDPLKYNLLFERFLNPDRISMPDIDIDFDDEGRGKVLRWVTEKYGNEKVAHIITYGTMATKMSIKDVARVHKLPLAESNRLAKLVPDRIPNKKLNLGNAIEFVPELKEAAESSDPLVSDTLKYAQMLEGNVRSTGVHACGVIIGQTDISDVVPISTAEDKETKEKLLVTQFEGSVIEETGLIKMDFLGLKTLSIIKDAITNIEINRGVKINIDEIDMEDKKTYQLYCNGQTTGTFQFESAGMQKYLKELQPSKFEDLIAMNALYRPGPMEYIPEFIRRKHGREEISYDLPIMEKYLSETYGITVYQEQVMLLSRLLADFTRGQSDELRKAMGKKQIDKMMALKEKFLSGGKKNGYDEKSLNKIWADWEKFASYAFNKSHATCYSWVAYQTAWLKANYPSEYMAAVLSNNLNNITEITKFMDECKAMGINVLSPDVNESLLKFSVNKEGDIRFGLGAIKSVGQGAVNDIIEERNKNGQYKDIFDFVERVNLSSVSRKIIEALALAGGFDSLPNIKREQFFARNSKDEEFIDTLIRYGSKYQMDKMEAMTSLFGDDTSFLISRPEIPNTGRWSDMERLNKERELIGIYLSAHPLDDYEFILKYVCSADTLKLQDLDALNGRDITFGGMVTVVREGQTKRGSPYTIFKIEDYYGSFEIALFSEDSVNFSKYARIGLALYIQAKVQPKRFRPDELEVKISSINLLSEMKDKLVNKITLQIPLTELDDTVVTELSALVKNNYGNSLLYFNIIGEESHMNIQLFSRSTKIQVNKRFIDYLKDNLLIDFKIN
ncbi:DNA polymerase III subunit alpha [Lascolabacillus sp.]|jgi:DNA polymerase-3 subunit alpha|uniref:DNA polymerase III subunit alpha n=1 Tax=Lascolabacillus sp. TaxID=1924068 RepID=UPI0011F8DBE2|nr:DNA polymerase III subunit alpha [Lascolabacillus sp.]MBP7103784.1 DNA polymerase III subunit alpha [Fermentimonas sp.]MDD2607297.1 DNA polymerase III subunit alpha [Lascolabacillus sp.]MDD4757796.1 DNA polymerase III subunit alpha [Lascolabacillus sp.]TAH62290.1 MAG: DNA polymerase III subunit alpha [Fermentimonas caenicola]